METGSETDDSTARIRVGLHGSKTFPAIVPYEREVPIWRHGSVGGQNDGCMMGPTLPHIGSLWMRFGRFGFDGMENYKSKIYNL